MVCADGLRGLPSAAFLALDLQVLQKTRAAFIEADASHGGNLDEDEFVNAFAGVLTTEEGGAPAALRKWVECVPVADSCRLLMQMLQWLPQQH